MRKLIKKVTAVLLAATMAFTPIVVNAEATTGLFEATKLVATQQGAQLMETLSIAGMTIAVVDIDNDFTWFENLGYANHVTGEPVTEYTLFSIGSTAKTFTAIAVMQLVEAGLLDLDEPITTYLPEFSMLPNPAFGGDYRNITARMLLAHVAGVHEFVGEGFFSVDGQDRYFMNSLMPALTNLHMQNEEANRTTYSNTGYTLLGILVASLTGSDNYFDGFVSYTQENIFAPAGMVSSSFEINNSNRAYLALPYIDATTIIDQFTYVSATPTGGMVSNASDMARFMHIMLGGGALDGDEDSRILAEETVQTMAQIQDFGINFPTSGPTGMKMGLGIMHWTRASGLTVVGHSGNLQHHTEMILDFDNGIGVFVCVNSATGAAAATALGEMIWATAVYEKTGEAPVPTVAARTPFAPENLQELAGWYTTVGELALSDDGVLSFSQIPGVPITIELTPMDDGTFDSVIGSVWFDQVEGIVFAFLGASMLGERMELTYADSSLDRWVGAYHYYIDGEVAATLYVGVNESGFATLSQSGIYFLMNKIDDYTYYFPGRIRGFGSVLEFSMDGDLASLRYSSQVMVRTDGQGQDAEANEITATTQLRFVIGNTEYTYNGVTHQMDSAPFIDRVYSRTMVPLRVIAEIFGAEVDWIPEIRTATIVLGDINLALSADEPLPGGMGRPHNINGHIFVPLAYIADALGVDVYWDGANQAAYVFG